MCSRRTFQNTFVKIVIAYVVLGFVAVEIPCLFILCRPFSQYWAIAPYSRECTTYHTYCIIQTVFNISSDALMLAIPIPLIVKTNVKPAKKAALIGVFGMGIFVILAAFLNKYYNFTMPGTTVYMLWHIREASVSVMVANLMCWWPLLRKIFGWKPFVSAKVSLSGRSRTIGVSKGKKRWTGIMRTGDSKDERTGVVDIERTGSRDAIVGGRSGKDVELLEIEGLSVDSENETYGREQHEKPTKAIKVTTEIELRHDY
jgi:hypothetical protein